MENEYPIVEYIKRGSATEIVICESKVNTHTGYSKPEEKKVLGKPFDLPMAIMMNTLYGLPIGLGLP